jgi:hypothetical protein
VIGKTALYALALKGDGIEEHHTSVGTVKSCFYARLHGFVYFPLLPAELRAKVYEHAVEEEDYPARCVSRLRYAWEMFPNSMSIKHFDSSYFPNVCKAIPEALPAYLQNANFIVDNHIHSLKDHSEFLAKMQPIPRGLPSILQLHFTNFASFDGIGAIDEQGHRIATNPSIDLMKQFPGLRHLRLTVFGSYALPIIQDRCGVKPSKDNVISDTAIFHGLEGFFDCRCLREIVFINREIEEEILQHYFTPDQRSHMNRHMEVIMEWIRVEFKARKQSDCRRSNDPPVWLVENPHD